MNRVKIFQSLAKILRDYISEKKISQKELAAQIGCSQSRLNDFLNKQDELGRAKFDLILRLFPELQRPILTVLESHDIGPQRNTRANVINNNFGSAEQTYNEAPRQDADAIRARITDLAVSLADDNGTLPLAPFLKALREVK